MAETSQAAAKPNASSWAPFRHQPFTVLWIATTISNMGMWMNDVGAGWLMTTLDPSPARVALVQTATALPVFLFALPAGALADIVDRRRMLLLVNLMAFLTAVVFAAFVAMGWVTVPVLLAFTFLLGCWQAFMQPAWQAIVPSLVPRAELPAAVALNSMAVNIARATGPALAGAIMVPLGIAVLFVLNAVSRVAVLAGLFWWRPPAPAERRLPPEPVGRAILTGLRYASRSQPLKMTLIRAVAFFGFASLYWATLPLIAREQLQGGPSTYGLLLGLIGLGALVGALGLPRLRARFDMGRIVMIGSLGTALAMAIFALGGSLILGFLAAFIAGVAWMAVLSSLNVSAQSALPDWVRARGLAIFIMVFFGTMSFASLAWGQIAARFGLTATLLASAIGLALSAIWSLRFALPDQGKLDLLPSSHWPEILPKLEVGHDRGPVMVEITYQIDVAERDDFLAALYAFREERYRDGAYDWNVFEDVETPGLMTEYFLVGSWLDHLRQHERVTRSDQGLQAEVRKFHRGAAPPVAHHRVAPEPRGGGRSR